MGRLTKLDPPSILLSGRGRGVSHRGEPRGRGEGHDGFSNAYVYLIVCSQRFLRELDGNKASLGNNSKITLNFGGLRG